MKAMKNKKSMFPSNSILAIWFLNELNNRKEILISQKDKKCKNYFFLAKLRCYIYHNKMKEEIKSRIVVCFLGKTTKRNLTFCSI